MQLVYFTVAALVVFLVAYGGFDLGGTVSAILLLTVLTIAATVRAAQPIIDWIKAP